MLSVSPSRFAESEVYSGSVADSLSITTMMNYLLQMTMILLGTQSNGAALPSASACFQSNQPSRHGWQDHIAASKRLQTA